jgi:pyruvate/2-oxoglutarate dehydrogenase complex dihydrolipoamide dehydrogenase (E3) component
VTNPDYDVLIIGGGQAGIPLVWALAQAGKRVALAERKQLGGSCINFGCTPTKAAIASAKAAQQARRAAEYGLRIPTVEVDFPAVLARASRAAAASRTGIERGFQGVDNPRLLPHPARLDGKSEAGFRVRVGDQVVTAAQVVLNTGTRSLLPPISGLRDANVIHAGNWLDRPQLPKHLAVLGAGYIGLEMGQFYRRMGSEVTIIDHNPCCIPHEDEEVSQQLQECLEAEGITFRFAVDVQSVEMKPSAESDTADRLTLKYIRNGVSEELSATDLFVATGRVPNTDDLGLETVGVNFAEHGFIAVDERLATNVEGIWAAGDIRGGPLFTHTSWDDNRILQSQLLGDGKRTTKRIVPYGIYTDPEVGRVGMTEAEARRSGRPIKTARFEMSRSGKAAEIGETHGFIRVIVDAETDRILGAAVVAAEGAELVHMYIDIMSADAPYTVIRDAIHIHPTLAEAVQSAVAALG